VYAVTTRKLKPVVMPISGALTMSSSDGGELEEAQRMLERSRELLAKPGFADKAPKEVVEKERAKLKQREERVKLLETELKKKRKG